MKIRFENYDEPIKNNRCSRINKTIYDTDIEEGMFDSGFSNVRNKVAKELEKHYIVTNVTKFMGDNHDGFRVTDREDPTHYFKFISTGNGVKCPGYFTNASLSFAVDKIVDTVLNN